MTETCDLIIYRGADFGISFTVKDETGTILDLTGCTVTSQLRKSAMDPNHIDFICTHNNSGGLVLMNMPWSRTAGINFTHGVFDVIITDEDGIREPALSGNVEIRMNVTKPAGG